MPGGSGDRISKGQKFRLKLARERGEPHYPAEAAKQRRDKRCTELAPIFLRHANVSLKELSSILAKSGIFNRNNKPLGTSQIWYLRKRINEMIQEGLIEPLDLK